MRDDASESSRPAPLEYASPPTKPKTSSAWLGALAFAAAEYGSALGTVVVALYIFGVPAGRYGRGVDVQIASLMLAFAAAWGFLLYGFLSVPSAATIPIGLIAGCLLGTCIAILSVMRFDLILLAAIVVGPALGVIVSTVLALWVEE